MAERERLTPIEIYVHTEFDGRDIKLAKKEIKRFSSETQDSLAKNARSFEYLKKLWGAYSSSLNKNNKQHKKAIDAVEASFSRVGKTQSRLTAAQNSKAKAELSLENARLKVAQKQQEVDNLSLQAKRSAEKVYSAWKDPKVSQEDWTKTATDEVRKMIEKRDKANRGLASAQNDLAIAEKNLENANISVTNSEKDLNREISKSIGITKNATDNVSKMSGAFSRVKTVAGKAGSAVGKALRKIKSIDFTRVISKFYAFSRVGSFLNSFVESSSEWIENLNLLEVVYNDTATSADEVKEKISELSKTFRMDINALAQYVSVFKQMANAMGQTAEVGTQMSEVLSLIALDVSSLRNVDVQTVVSDFTGALAGQVKPVRKYGFDITMYSIDELMKELGYGAIARSMTQANKQLARAVLLVRQSKDAWGDLSKTINTYANQQRILNDQFIQFKRLIGNVLIGSFKFNDSLEEASKTAGIVQKGIWYLNGAMIAINTILEAIVPSAEQVNGAIAQGAEDATDAIEEENKAIEGTLAGFDKFNSLESGSNSHTSVTEALSALLGTESSKYMEEFESRLSSIRMYAEEISDKILGFLFPEYTVWKGNNAGKTFADWAEKAENFDSKIKDIKESLLGMGQMVLWIVNPLLGAFSTAAIDLLETEDTAERTEKLEALLVTLEKISEAVVTLGRFLYDAFRALEPVISFIATVTNYILDMEGGVWALIAAVLGLVVAFAALKGAMSGGGLKALLAAGVAAGVSAVVFTVAGSIGAAKANKHAQGGFQTGGLFYAGEAGPEWVGRQGSTSTIINDGQMSDIMRDSVAKGVMQANIASRQISGAGRSGKVAVVNLNGKHLFDVVEQEGYKEGKVFAKSR